MGNVSIVLKNIHGAIGKKLVVKHYGKKVVMSAYPDMSAIKPSIAQLQRRNLFKAANEYARRVYQNSSLREEWMKKTGERARLYGRIVGEYMKGC